MKLKIVLSRYVKNYVGILVRIASSLKIAFDRKIIFTILILWIHEHGKYFHLLNFLQFLSFFPNVFNHTFFHLLG